MSSRYITITEGEDFRTIATKMTNMGYKMNHATARNILLAGMKKFVSGISEQLGQPLSEEQTVGLIMRQDIHEVIGDILALCIEEEHPKCPVAIHQ